MRGNRFCFSATLILALCSAPLFGQQSSSASPAKTAAKKGPKVCVAGVGNASGKPIFTNEIEDELMKDLLAAGLNAEGAGSSSLVAKGLNLSADNKESFRFRKCDFLLLTVADLSKAPADAGAASGLALTFALFKAHVAKAVIDTAVDAPSADTPTHAVNGVVEKEVEQVGKAVNRKPATKPAAKPAQ